MPAGLFERWKQVRNEAQAAQDWQRNPQEAVSAGRRFELEDFSP
jgi:hypothetical protein